MTEPQTTTFSGAKSACRMIPFEIISEADSALRHVPMTGGLCIPKGQLFEPGEWLVEGLGGSHAVAEVEELNRWSDGSIRWLLAHLVAAKVPSGRTSCQLIRPENRPQNITGAASLRWGTDTLTLQLRPKVDRPELISTVKMTPKFHDADGKSVPLTISDVTEEVNGSLRCVYFVKAAIEDHPFVEVRLRLEIWPTTGAVKVDTRIRNTRRAQHKGGLWDLGDPGSFLFRGLHLNIIGVHGQGTQLAWRNESTTPVHHGGEREALRLLQRGSGGPAWSNTNHVNADGESPVSERGYCAQSETGIFRGYRSEPVIAMESDDDRVSVAVPEFWQQFPSSLSTDLNVIRVGLFPVDADQVFELQGGEQKSLSTWISVREIDDDLNHLNWAYQPPRLIPTLPWVKNCKVVSWLPAQKSFEHDAAQRFTAYLDEATTGDRAITARRDSIDEYGWRNFGDIPANHEQTHYAGSNTIISHYNNQFDLVFGGILNLLTSGDSKWFDLFDPLARHVMDIDVYHTHEDRDCFNGGLFWHTDHYVDARTSTHRTYSQQNAVGKDSYGGGPANEHNYTTGLLYYHFLTGSADAKETVLTLADWVIAMDDGAKTVFGLLDSGDTGLASQTVFEDFHGPGRGVGNSINALLDAWLLTTDAKYMAKADQLIRRAIHPLQDLDALHLSDPEGHWSYTVCLTALGRYLDVKLEAGECDEQYAYVRSSLAHYGRWMIANERPTLSVPEKLDYPTEAWAAQDFRKANVLRIAASCTDDATEEAAMRRKADELNDAAWKDLYSFDSQHLTARCLSILMTEGLRDVFHRTCRLEYAPPVNQVYDWGTWTMFVPQKQRVKQLLKNPLGLATAAVRAFNPQRLINTIDALRRQL